MISYVKKWFAGLTVSTALLMSVGVQAIDGKHMVEHTSDTILKQTDVDVAMVHVQMVHVQMVHAQQSMQTSEAALAKTTTFQTNQVPAEENPHALVERIINQVLAVLDEERAVSADVAEEINQAVGNILAPVVAFDYIAKGVMGEYAKDATADQRQRFSESFQAELISTYAKGMAVYKGLKMEIVPLKGSLGERNKVKVIQRVYGDGDDSVIFYSMRKKKATGEWKLLNVVFNGINLGKTFRSQFAHAMKKHRDLEVVINNWGSQA